MSLQGIFTKEPYKMDSMYTRNIPSISEEEQNLLASKKVFVAGCGGLGGFIIEFLVRAGVGSVRAADGDVFSESNLNRQILSDREHIGKSKVLTARERALAIRPDMDFEACECFIDSDNIGELVSGCDLAIDALDSIRARCVLSEACRNEGIPMVHGAIDGWLVQASTVYPQDSVIDMLYAGREESTKTVSTLSFIPAACAAIEAAEAVKILTGKEPSLRNRLLMADMKNMTSDVIDFA